MAIYSEDVVNKLANKVEALRLELVRLYKVIRKLKCDNYNLRLELRDLKEDK